MQSVEALCVVGAWGKLPHLPPSLGGPVLDSFTFCLTHYFHLISNLIMDANILVPFDCSHNLKILICSSHILESSGFCVLKNQLAAARSSGIPDFRFKSKDKCLSALTWISLERGSKVKFQLVWTMAHDGEILLICLLYYQKIKRVLSHSNVSN
jgi:hypothetical protein